MIDYKEYKDIIDYLNKEELEDLKKYLEKEREKVYSKEARKELRKYLVVKNSTYMAKGLYTITENGNLFLANDCSAYLLDNCKILTNDRKEVVRQRSKKDKKILSEMYGFYSRNIESKFGGSDISFIPNPYLGFVDLRDNETDQILTFDKKILAYADAFLEGDISYSLSEEKIMCKVSSHKGQGLIMGIRKN